MDLNSNKRISLLNTSNIASQSKNPKQSKDVIVISSDSEAEANLPSTAYEKNANKSSTNFHQNLKRKANSRPDSDITEEKKQRFQSNLNRECYSETRSNELPVYEKDQLSKEIFTYCKENQQQSWLLERKHCLARALENSFNKGLGLRCQIFIVGSSVNGFGRFNSDCDLCLVIDKHSTTLEKFRVMRILNDVRQLLRNTSFVRNLQLIPAKVRIIKFQDSMSGLDCDLNVNNLTGVRNTQLLHAYALQDPRVRPIVFCVKEWAHQNEINEARLGTLSSYCLALMVVHYLQFGVKPCVLPNLQRLYPSRFSPETSIDDVESLARSLPVWRSQNKQSLSELLVGFFQYFTSYDYKKVISIRQSNCFQVDDSSPRSPWYRKLIRIEEPFDLTNASRAVQNDKFMKIRWCFKKATQRLKPDGRLQDLIQITRRSRSSFGDFGVSSRLFN